MNIEDLHGMQLPGAALINSPEVVVMICWACGKVPEVVAFEVGMPYILKLCCTECGGGIQVIGQTQTRNFLTKLPEMLESYQNHAEEMRDRHKRAAEEHVDKILSTVRGKRPVAAKTQAAKPGK